MFGRWAAIGALVWSSSAACASEAPEVEVQTAALRTGNPAGPPAFASLPDVPVGDQTPHTQQGLSLARQVFANALPEAPPDRRYSALQAWIDQTVVAWIAARREAVDETRFQFAVDKGASATEQVVARGVLGLLQESTALELTHIPSPAELDTEPEIAEIFHDLVTTQAEPFRRAAIAEFRSCAKLAAAEGGDVRPWARFCSARFHKLRGDPERPEPERPPITLF
jgi:hypothetical protein